MAERFGVDELHVPDLLRLAGACTERLVCIRMERLRPATRFDWKIKILRLRPNEQPMDAFVLLG